ncbi:hypothetical protein NL64_06440 [Pseudomonas fluorescens]|uniref:SNF2-related protein n=1 Tax=Pseudomonas fluorescens TaxID=294 RepID=UPI00054BA699|nr:DEAD/DEAH box helicase [Pseudomonas fluorescens]KII34892.1 hypothetical protein NL64_06440 [Pseudomonas fluorescens]
MIPPLFAHQEANAAFKVANPRMLDGSDPGTGKTRSTIEAFSRLKEAGLIDHMLVLAPLSILRPSWSADCHKFAPHLEVSVATAKDKATAMWPATQADIYITNHDSVKWLKDIKFTGRWALCVDEFPAFKNRTSQRSKALATMRKFFEFRWLLSGTMNSNGACDIWHPMFLCDDGERLGKQFWGYRSQVCEPKATGPGGQYVEWVDKPFAPTIIADRLKDITFRVKLEDCLDMPEHVQTTMLVDIPKKLMGQYRQLQREAVLEHASGSRITAVHASAKTQKLLQLCSGAVYDGQGGYQVFDTSRTDLAMELVMQRDQSVVAFLWKHQKEALVAAAEALGITYAVIDGETKLIDREIAVNRYQAGQIKVIFAHPQSAGHGLTLTNGTATIWPSPTYNAEHFVQFNHRIYRAGQTQRTETICIAAAGTAEEQVYEKLNGKVGRMDELMGMLVGLQAA